MLESSGVYDFAKILIWKQITTCESIHNTLCRCIWLCKDTNLKANHNIRTRWMWNRVGVYDFAKILIWKQITTFVRYYSLILWCIWLCKDTNLKANHNSIEQSMHDIYGVYDFAKILIWKQITTELTKIECLYMVYMTLQRY